MLLDLGRLHLSINQPIVIVVVVGRPSRVARPQTRHVDSFTWKKTIPFLGVHRGFIRVDFPSALLSHWGLRGRRSSPSLNNPFLVLFTSANLVSCFTNLNRFAVACIWFPLVSRQFAIVQQGRDFYLGVFCQLQWPFRLFSLPRALSVDRLLFYVLFFNLGS